MWVRKSAVGTIFDIAGNIIEIIDIQRPQVLVSVNGVRHVCVPNNFLQIPLGRLAIRFSTGQGSRVYMSFDVPRQHVIKWGYKSERVQPAANSRQAIAFTGCPSG